jgi:CBS domain-containing protein
MELPMRVSHRTKSAVAEPSVGEVMARNVHTCSADDTLDKAARLMWEHDCGAVPVVDGARHVIGVITDRDVCMAAYTQGALLSAIRVGDIMSSTPQTCASDDLLSKAGSVIRRHRVRRIPVVDHDGILVGILSISDLVRCAANGLGDTHVDNDDLVQTFAAVCEPWLSIQDRAHDGVHDKTNGSG